MRLKSKPLLLPWRQVQDLILSILKSQDPQDATVTVPYGLQMVHSLHHQYTLRCMTFYHATSGDIYVSHYDAGVTNQMQLWTVNLFSELQVKSVKFDIKPTILCLIFIPKLRVFAGFCNDMIIRIFSDSKHCMSEITSALCLTTILCMVYNDAADELIAGGQGYLHSWKLTHTRMRGPLLPGRNFDCNLNSKQWVTSLKLDKKYHQLLALCDNGVFIIDYRTNRQTHFIKNWHETSLSCCVFYHPSEYFITASKGGCIKVWNAVVFSMVHEFIGHQDSVTGLIIHPTDPLVLSSSKDGTIRVWRLDTFEQTFRLDIGEKIYDMKLTQTNHLYYRTLEDIKIWNFNQFHHLFTPIQSCVHKLSKITSPGMPTRILCAAEDGSVRLLSSVCGSVLTIIYPMATYQVLTDIVYDPRNDRIYIALATGEVLVFDTSSNPCCAYQLWVPNLPDEAILCITLMKMQCALGEAETSKGQTLVFAGHCNGQITLMESDTVVMKSPVQAHNGMVTMLDYSHGIYDNHATSVGGADRLLSIGTDKKAGVWEITVSGSKLTLTLLQSIFCDMCATHVSMIGNVMSLAFPNNRVSMYQIKDIEGNERTDENNNKRRTAVLLSHHKDEDHTQQITAICCCPRLRLFATTSCDGSIKIWDTDNQLVRELCLDHTVRGVCFANDRGDLLVGFQNHVSYISVANYLPVNLLEKIVSEDFVDDLLEEPIPFNPHLQLWFDIHNLLALPANLTGRRLMFKYIERLNSVLDCKESKTEQLTVKETEVILKRLPSIIVNEQDDNLSTSQLQQISQLTMYSMYNIKRAQSPHTMAVNRSHQTLSQSSIMDSKMDIPLSSDEQIESRKDSENEEEAAENKLEEEVNKDKNPWPIAPDGYIPNSVIRALMGYKPPPINEIVIPWRLKPVPEKLTHSPTSSLQETLSPVSSEEPFIWQSDSEEEDFNAEPEGISQEYEDEEDEYCDVSMPMTGNIKTNNLFLQKRMNYTPGRVTLPGRLKPLQKKTEDKVVEEAPKEVVIPMVLMRISSLQWFPKDEELTQSNVVRILIELLDKVNQFQHRGVCKAVMDIHKELGLEDEEMNAVVQKLTQQLQHEKAMVRVNAVKTLGDLGLERKSIIFGLLPRLSDTTDDVRQEAINTITKLTGVRDKEGLQKLLIEIGAMKPIVNRDREVIQELAERMQLQLQQGSKRMADAYQSTCTKPDDAGTSLNDGVKTPSMLEIWVANTQPGLRPEDEDLAKDFSAEEVAEVVNDGFSPWEHAKQRQMSKPKLQKRTKFAEKPQTLAPIDSYSDMSATESQWQDLSMVNSTARMYQSIGRIQRRTVAVERHDGYMERMILKKEALAIEMKERLQRHRQKYDEMMKKRKQETSKFLPNKATLYASYRKIAQGMAQPRPTALENSKVVRVGNKLYIKKEDKLYAVGESAERIVAEHSTANNVRVVNLDEQCKIEVESNSLFTDSDSGIHSININMKSSNKPDPTGIADESDKLQDMYTTTEISLVDSGVGYMSDSSSVFKINKRISSDMSSISKPEETVRNAQYVDKASRNTAEVENWQELFERPTAQQRKQFYQQRQKEKQHKMQRVPQIMYHSDKVRLVDNVAGQRILKELSVMDRIGKHPDGEMQWRSIAPIPARLSVHTHGEKTGNTKFGLLNMSWTSGLPKFQHDSRIGNECNIPQLDISRDQGRQRLQDYMLPSSSSFIASNLHRNWQAKRCNLLTSCSSQATHSDYQWESHKTIKISTASADTTLPPRDGKIQNCVTTNVKQQMPPSLNLPKMRPTAIIGTKALNKLNSNSKLPDITASLRFLTSRKDEVPQNA